jgi:hypothetical protein
MIVYNDIDYVERAILSVKDWVDEMIIVEGAFKITMEGGRPARSDDGTLDVISKYVDNKKIFLTQVNLQEHRDHYETGYRHAVENDSDWAIMIDSDEVWTTAAQIIADAYMKSQRTAHEIRVQEYCFVNDFKHYYTGTYPRIFKTKPAGKFVYDNEVMWGNQRGKHPILTIPGRNIFHYGYVRNKKRWEMKQEYMFAKDGNPAIKNDYKIKENEYILPADIPIYEFTGTHPETMKNHPFHDMSAGKIIYG